MGKRYYWLKLKEDFFSSKRIKKLRRLAGGDTYTIIYLKMQLKAMKTDGVLKFDGLENSFAEELALDIDEEPDNVQVTLNYLLSCGLAETSDDVAFFFPFSIENTGSETSSAQRVRECRARKAAADLPGCSADVLHCNNPVTESKRKEIDTDKDRESDIELEGSGGKGTQADTFLTLGPNKNVLLTPYNYDFLKNNYSFVDEAISRLSNEIQKNGDNHQPHFTRLLEWLTAKAMSVSQRQSPPAKTAEQSFEDKRQAAIAALSGK